MTHVALPMMACEGDVRQKQSTGIALLNRYAILSAFYEASMGRKEETVSFKASIRKC